MIWHRKGWRTFGSPRQRLEEDALYGLVIDEISREEFDPIAQARSFEEAEGDHEKARALYIKHRIRRLRDISEFEQDQPENTQPREAQDQFRSEKKVNTNSWRLNTSSWREERKEKLKASLQLGMPTSEIKRIYGTEFRVWMPSYVSRDYSRQFLTVDQLWVAFIEIKLSDLS